MRNIWYQHPAKFEFSGNKVRAKFEPTTVKHRRQQGSAYLLDTPEHWQSWLDSFCTIKDEESLKSYLRSWGFPHLSKAPKVTTLEEDVDLLLGSAAFMRWTLCLLEAVKRNSTRDIKFLCTPKKTIGSSSNKVILVPREEGHFPNWNGFQKLGSYNKSPIDFEITCSEEDLRRGTWKVPISAARDYVIQSINKLVEGISPRMDRRFVPIFVPRTPYEAMCLNLLGQATGTSVSKICERPGCSNLLFGGVTNENHSRKRRKDRKYCSQKCRQYVYDEAKRLNRKEEEKDE